MEYIDVYSNIVAVFSSGTILWSETDSDSDFLGSSTFSAGGLCLTQGVHGDVLVPDESSTLLPGHPMERWVRDVHLD